MATARRSFRSSTATDSAARRRSARYLASSPSPNLESKAVARPMSPSAAATAAIKEEAALITDRITRNPNHVRRLRPFNSGD